MSGFHYQSNCSPARTLFPQIRSTQDTASQYLAELLAERRKLGPFLQVLPICDRLLNQEILLASKISSERGYRDFDKLQYRSPSPMSSWNLISNINAREFTGSVGQEMPGILHGSGIDWQGAPASPSSYIVKKIICFEIPVAQFPNFNFIGRLLGPKGNSLKRLESSTGCRVYVRGKGSIKDPEKEEKLRGKPGYEHLNDPLHILIEAEFPSDIVDSRLRQAQEAIEELLKPVDESQNLHRKQQLQELEMLNSNFIVDSPHRSASVSPHRHNGSKHPNIWK